MKVREIYNSKKLKKSWGVGGVIITGDPDLLKKLEDMLRERKIIENINESVGEYKKDLFASSYKVEVEDKRGEFYYIFAILDEKGYLRIVQYDEQLEFVSSSNEYNQIGSESGTWKPVDKKQLKGIMKDYLRDNNLTLVRII